MRTLNVQAASSLRLGPLKDAPGLTYTFGHRTDNDTDTGAKGGHVGTKPGPDNGRAPDARP